MKTTDPKSGFDPDINADMKSNKSDAGRDADLRSTPSGRLRQLAWLRETVGLITAPAWVRFTARGADTISYFHRRLSANVRDLAIGRGAHALQLEGDGRMSADMLVYRTADGLDFLVQSELAESDFEIAGRYVINDDVTLDPAWQSERAIGLAGPRAADLLGDVAGDTASGPDLDAAWMTTGEMMTGEIIIAGTRCTAYRDSRWDVPFFWLTTARENFDEVRGKLAAACEELGGGRIDEEAGAEAGAEPGAKVGAPDESGSGADVYVVFRIEQGIALFGTDTNDRTIPLEAGLAGTIDFEKGCFPGQEIIARIKNLGHPAHCLARFEIDGDHPFDPGQAVVKVVGGDDMSGTKDAGRVTSSASIPGLGRTVALGYLAWNYRDEPTVTIEMPGGSLRADVTLVSRWTSDSKIQNARAGLRETSTEKRQ